MRQLIAAATLAAGLCLSTAAAQAANPQVEFRTTAGSFTMELYQDKAPKTVANFLQYVNEGFYKGTIFHRVIPGFMVQGGGFERNMQEKTKTRGSIENEAGNGLKNELGTVAMARTSAPHSASAQFFVNVSNNEFLNFREPTPSGYGYAVFGKVIKGMDVVNKIVSVPTGNSGPHQNVPLTPIVVEEAAVVKTASAAPGGPAAKDAAPKSSPAKK